MNRSIFPQEELNSSASSSAIKNYNEILSSFGAKHIELVGYYYSIGNVYQRQGWMFHIPILDIQFELLYKELFPFLINKEIPFLIPINNEIHNLLQNGLLGYKNLGKIIIIIPQEETMLKELARELLKMTENFKGISIPIDFHLGNILYTRYGSFNTNPIESENIILDNMGNLIIDDQPIPPRLYKWTPWPFEDIKNPIITKYNDILINKYLIRRIIKADVKGRVLLCIFQKNFISYKKCIIKEGISGISVDELGRDISDRLNWQLDVYERLKSFIPMPRIIEIFNEQNNSYIVFEYIKGHSFRELLTTLYQGNSWMELSIENKKKIIEIIIQLINNVAILHKNGYIHRDLNIENILIDNKNMVWLIDFELSYDLNKAIPNPPYQRGTDGFISPEQFLSLPPLKDQDIYSIGAILIKAFTNITPHRFNHLNPETLKNHLYFFINDREIVNLILSCLEIDHKKRPPLNNISNIIEAFYKNISQQKLNFSLSNIENIDNAIQSSLETLSLREILSEDNYWTSPLSISHEHIGNLRFDRTVYTGFRKGISGISYIICDAKHVGYQTSHLNDLLLNNFTYVKKRFFLGNDNLPTGLYRGSYGVGIGLFSLLRENLIIADEINLNLFFRCFETLPDELNIADGLAGYGIALLKCQSLLPKELLKNGLTLCIQEIIKKQLSNGAWEFGNDKKVIITGFSHGIAGIIWFLLSYAELYQDKKIVEVALKGLHYLQKTSRRYKKQYVWKLLPKSKEIHEFENGGYSILLPFIKAFCITGNKIYREIVEETLRGYPTHIVADFVSIERGIAGLGEIYIEAWKAFGNTEWLIRAQWIADVLIHTSYQKNKYCFWLYNDPFVPIVDLLTGHCGILHFLLRLRHSEKIGSIY